MNRGKVFVLVCLVWFVGLVSVVVTGCITSTDPTTGETLTGIDPNAAATGEAVAEGAVSVLNTGVLGAVGTGIAGVLVGVLGAWRKVKPELVAQKTTSDQYHAVSSAIVSAIEEFKKTNADDWSSLKGLLETQLGKAGIDTTLAENIIRGLRGLPLKE